MYARILHGVGVLVLTGAALPLAAVDVGAGDYTVERWNDPIRREHNWDYWDMIHDPTGAHPKEDMFWVPRGGLADSGYVWSPLGDLEPYHSPQAYWPAYLTSRIAPLQRIDLTQPGAEIRVYASDISAHGAIDLQGGRLHLFIGEWISETDWRFFYNRTPLVINDHHWSTESVVPVGGDADWGLIAGSIGGTAGGASALFHHPEQWGFTIFAADSTPAGTLALDAFRIVPEPSALTLAAWPALVLLGRRLRR
jgi:hypothetical protein